MTTFTAERLYALLPAIHRLRDADQDHPLRSLLAVIAREIGIVEEDIARLYANWFIETSDEWVVPYIGDLVGVRGLHALEATGFTRRAFVANTLSYRRRKGTPTMLEQLARDATLWNARVVEFFELLGTTQCLNHLRPHNVRTPDLRQTNALELLDTPFDSIAHTADVRRIAGGGGKHNIPNIGIFLWRLQAYDIARSTPRSATNPPDGRYTFSPLGNDAPLFNRPQTETTINHLADEVNVPGRLRRRALHDDLENYRQVLTTGEGRLTTRFFDPDQPVLQVYFDQLPLNPEEMIACDLSGWASPGWEPPTSQPFVRKSDGSAFETKVAVDPVLGRLAVLKKVTNPPTRVEVRFAYGFSGDLGGGPYDRRFVSGVHDPAPSAYGNTVAAPNGLSALYRVPTDFATIALAIDRWRADGQPSAVIQIDDSRTYEENLTIPMAATDLVIQAANRQRPTLIGDVSITGNQPGRLALDGLLIAGSLSVADDDSLRQLDVVHCTLVPGVMLAVDGAPLQPETPSIIAGPDNKSLKVNAVRSISGPLRIGGNAVGLHARDCIIESPPAFLPVLVSADLSTFPHLSADPKVRVTIGGDGPYLAQLAAVPTSLAQARSRLQQAIRKAHPSKAKAFADVQVIVLDDRLVVLPGLPIEIEIETVKDDKTADLLGLTKGASQQRLATLSGVLAPFPALSAATPELTVRLGEETHVIALTPKPTTLAAAGNRLRAAIQAVSAALAFAQAFVTSLADRIVIIPGAPGVVPAFDVTASDPTTLAELGLPNSPYLPAIGGDRSGAQPGPVTTLERVTVLGPVHVKELALASEVIFRDPVRAVRRQTGCARFSYVPPGSETPRCFRCQPELAITSAVEQARELIPTFTSTRYGDPAYGQLSLACPTEIRTGAEDGSEMGAFSFLKQPQRMASLQSNLEEYLRFGLETGIFFVT